MDFEGMEEMSSYEGKQFISSLDGPVTRNDNAAEACAALVHRGQRLFSVLSRYDDALSFALRRQGFKSGDVLRLVLPFLKAYGVTDVRLQDLSRKAISLVPGSDKAMRFVQELMAPFVVSSSYEHHVSAACESIGFPFDNAYCTRVALDPVRIDDWEAQILKNHAQEIALMPLIEVPAAARSLRDFSARDQRSIARLDEIFWQEMGDLASFRLVQDVSPLGGDEKAACIVDICKKTGVGLEDTMYVGSGSVDAQALALVKRGGGIAMAFNGSEQAVREAEVAVVSENAVVTSVLMEAFHRAGRDGVLALVDRWDAEGISGSGLVHDYLVREMRRVFPGELPRVSRVTQESVTLLAEAGERARRTARGDAVGGTS